MIISPKRDNYKNFDVFSDNMLVPRSYFIPFSNMEELLKTDIRTERYSSSLVKCLSGEWEFKYYEKRSDMPEKFDTSADISDKVNVPSTWQHTGYEKPYYVNTRYQFKATPPTFPTDCPVGIYVKKFEIDDIDSDFIITFLGVAGSMDLFCNGEYVGYSEGSHNTSEFELGKFLKIGENEIAVVNHKWCNGTYIECQDMYRDNGIFRDVLLKKSGANSIYDIEIKTEKNKDKYSLSLIPTLKLTSDADLFVSLYDGEDLVKSKSVNENLNNIEMVTFDDLDVLEWSSESPKLYDLIITLSTGEKINEIVRKKVGFKHIEIEGNKFYFNDKLIKMLGVNHHDTNPSTGFAMSVADMEKDVKIFKEYNVNTVRTSHYPPDATFLDLCDEYGIYVIDEADIEAHGVWADLRRPNLISNDLKWKEHYLDRVMRMYSRDKNHPSITMWSLGNEAGGCKNQDYCYNNLKELTDIPIHYEGACRTRRWAYDVVSQMYPFHNVVKKVADGKGLPKKYYRAPYFMCEYAHAMGMGAGDLEKYVNEIYRGDNFLGGCIWEFADHCELMPDGNYKYGGDNNEWRHDVNFCVDGLFFPDRTPHAGALQMKNCYRPVRCKYLKNNQFEFKNHNVFENAKCVLKYRVISDGAEVEKGQKELNIPPQKTYKTELSYDISGRDNCHNVIIFEYVSGDRIIADEQFVLTSPIISSFNPKCEAPKVSTSENKLVITTDYGEIIYNATTGFFESYSALGVELFNKVPLYSHRGFGVSLYRAPLDNDMNMRRAWEKNQQNIESFYAVKKGKVGTSYTVKDNCVEIFNSYFLSTPQTKKLATCNIIYTVYKTGKINVSVTTTTKQILSNIPRYGVVLEMPKVFNNVKYYGLGPKQSLSDFKEHCHFGIFNEKVSTMHENYIKPQESATRIDTRWAQITDDNGIGLRFEAEDKAFIFSANHFTSDMCSKALHRENLYDMNSTVVHIDDYCLGAGSNSCGPPPTSEHVKKRLIGENFKFSIEFIGDKND